MKSHCSNGYNPKTVEAFLHSLGHIDASGCTEIRIITKERYMPLNGRREYVGKIVAGYYTDYEKAAQDIAPFDGHAHIYVTLNPCDKKLMRRAYNRLAFNVETTAEDKDILSIRWFPFDIDPVRPTGTPASDDELQAALDRRDQLIREAFAPYESPVIRAMSGNGGHGLIPLPNYPNNDETRAKIQQLLDYLALTYTDDVVSVDTTVGNPARIWKVYGTLAVKGDNTPLAPYRRAYADFPNQPLKTFDLFHVLDNIIPADFHNGNTTDNTSGKKATTTRTYTDNGDYPDLDVDAYLEHYNVEVAYKKPKDGGTVWRLEACPFNPDHFRDAQIIKFASGATGFTCPHNSCADKDWQTFKAKVGDPKPFYNNKNRNGSSTHQRYKAQSGDEHPDSEKHTGTSPIEAWAAIKALDAPTQAAIQALLWDFTQDASHWTRTQLGQFSDELHTAFAIPRAWLDEWKRAANEEKRDRAAERKSAGSKDEAQELEPEITFTEGWTAREFVKKYGQDIRYCPLWKKFIVYDGKRWVIDYGAVQVTRKCKRFIREMYAQAAEIDNDPARKLLVEHAIEHDNERKYRAVIELTKSEVPITPEMLDADPMLLNCLNGTIDLEIGELREHRRSDYITKMCPVEYDPDAQLDIWDNVIAFALPDKETRDFVQRAIGYSCTGYATEEALFFPYGPTATGKSTILAAVHAALGDYAASADFETLLAQVKDKTGRPKTELARLHGKRFVVSVEVDHGVKLAEGLVKWITGQDPVVARKLYSEEFEFMPSFCLWLAANHRPQVRDDDDAIWRRILQIPFDQQIPKEKRDKEVKKQLRDPAIAGPAVLAWAVKGCVEWQRRGLAVPKRVEETTAAYREEMNPLKDFFEEACVIKPSIYAPPTALWEAYEAWCEDNGIKYPLRKRDFWTRLQSSGFQRGKARIHGKPARVYHGVGIRGCDGDDDEGVDVVDGVDTTSDNFSDNASAGKVDESTVYSGHNVYSVKERFVKAWFMGHSTRNVSLEELKPLAIAAGFEMPPDADLSVILKRLEGEPIAGYVVKASWAAGCWHLETVDDGRRSTADTESDTESTADDPHETFGANGNRPRPDAKDGNPSQKAPNGGNGYEENAFISEWYTNRAGGYITPSTAKSIAQSVGVTVTDTLSELAERLFSMPGGNVVQVMYVNEGGQLEGVFLQEV